MDFIADKAIYLQIADYIGDRILRKEWVEHDRIPSVRELSVLLTVNPNTVVRAYEVLENDGIIYSKRGIGFLVSEAAFEKVSAERKRVFMEVELPNFYRKMQQLNISWEQVTDYVSYIYIKGCIRKFWPSADGLSCWGAERFRS